MLVVALRNRERPAVVLAAPVMALVVLAVVVTLGERLLDWTA